MSGISNDFKYAVRMLRRNPSFALVSVATLALAMGANGALFSLVDAVMLKPLPFEEPDRIVEIWDSSPTTPLGEKSRVSSFNYHHWRAQVDAVEAMALYGSATFSLVSPEHAVQVSGTRVSEDYFKALGLSALRGRLISEQDFVAGAAPVAVVSHSLWVNSFAADPGLLGSQLKLDGTKYTVVGVLAPQIMPVAAQLGGQVKFSRGDHVWVAMNPVPNRVSAHVFGVLGRISRGSTVEEARRQLETVARRLETDFPDSHRGMGVRVTALIEEAVGTTRRPLFILLGAVGLVLLVACVNVVNLTLVQADGRSREMAVRVSLGADRRRLIRQFVVEGCLVSLAGGGLGLVAAYAGVLIFPLLSPAEIPRLQEATVDLRVAGVTFAVALAAGVVFGLVATFRADRIDLQAQLREARGPGQRGAPSIRRLLLTAEVALAVVLVTGSGLLIRSFDRILEIDLGFSPASEVLTLDFLHSTQRYQRIEQLVGFYDQFFAEVRSLPGVESVAAGYDPPLQTNWIQGFRIEDAPPPRPDRPWSAHFRTVTDGYFKTLNIPLVSGRLFQGGDATDSRPGAVIVNQSFAATYFPQAEPLGRRLAIYTTQWLWGDSIPQTFEIVGVVKDVRFAGVRKRPVPAFYLPFRQTPQHRMTVFVKTRGAAAPLVDPIRARLRKIDPEQPLAAVSTIADELAGAVSQPRFSMTIFSAFAAAALLLAAIGLWGLISEIVRRSRHEIGVRMAVGANASRIFGWTIRKGMTPVLMGLPLGMAGAVAGGRLLRSLLYETSPLDPLVFAVVPLALLAIATVCCAPPALHAARTDPVSALRSE